MVCSHLVSQLASRSKIKCFLSPRSNVHPGEGMHGGHSDPSSHLWPLLKEGGGVEQNLGRKGGEGAELERHTSGVVQDKWDKLVALASLTDEPD